MSHAWNACGFHDPRGFKSHILRQCEVSRHRSYFGVSRFFFFTPQPGSQRRVMGPSKISPTSPKVSLAGASTKNMVPFCK